MKLILISLLLFLSQTAIASTVSLEYQGFYQRLKLVNEGNFPHVELVFFVPNNGNCQITSGSLTTEKEQFPLTITPEQRIFLPYDKRLKSDRALVNLTFNQEIGEDFSQCNIAIQLRAKSTQEQYQQSQLLTLSKEMDRLLNKMQGFPMRYFTDDTVGLIFHFSQENPITVTVNEQVVALIDEELKQYKLAKEQLKSINTLAFSVEPTVVSPWLN